MKFIIVDDEPLALENFAGLTDWKQYGYDLVGTARNGREALDLVHRKHPDIVITDIRMPVMDGLTLCGILQREAPEIEVIILTAFRDFEYAKQAISYGANEYLLKNEIEEDNVIRVLNRASESIRKQSAQRNAAQRSYFQNVMLDVETEEDLRIDTAWKQCCIMLIRCRCSAWDYVHPEKESISFDIPEIDQLARDNGMTAQHVIWLEAETWAVMLTDPEGDLFEFANMTRGLSSLIYSVGNFFEEHFQKKVFITFGLSFMDSQKIKENLDAMKKISDCAPFVKTNLPRLYWDLSYDIKRSESIPKEEEEILAMLEQALNQLDGGKVKDAFRGVEAFLKGQDKDIGLYDLTVSRITEMINRKMREEESGGSMKTVFGEQEKRLREAADADAVFSELESVLAEYCGSANAPGQNRKMNRKIQRALSYIRSNYNRHITAKDAADAVGLSEVYFSSMFKTETGMTFGNYLTDYRIQMAKKLLQEDSLKIYEISEAVGYTSPQYFSQVFQRKTGMTPLEFKEQCGI